MKKSIFFTGVFLFSFAMLQSQVFNLSDQELINCLHLVIRGNDNSAHYIRPVILEVENPSEDTISVKIENGLMLMPVQSFYQPVVITRSDFITLLPGQSAEKEIFGMCTKADLVAPESDALYIAGGFCDPIMQCLTNRIEIDSLHNTEAQLALWNLTDDRRLEDIAGFDQELANDLIHTVAELTHQDLPPQPDETDYLRNFYSTTFRRKMGGVFKCSYRQSCSVSIAMFNKDGVLVRELYNNPSMSPGEHNLDFAFDATVYTDDYYYVRVIEDGRVSVSLKVNTPKIPDDRG
ncbi:MAG TPA: hypothetical protein PK915_04580 [Bacteroidales bacterium]|nr:hypothetical protein [Bacteroidales bacterium]